MPANHIVSDWKKLSELAFRTLDSRLLANPAHPLVRTGGGIARSPRLPAFEPTRIDVISPAKQRAETPNLGVSRRVLMNETRFWNHGCDRLNIHVPLAIG